MRRYLKKQVKDILSTMSKASEVLQKNLLANQGLQAKNIVENLCAGAEELVVSVPDEDEATTKFKECMVSYVENIIVCLKVKKVSEKISLCNAAKQCLEKAEEILINDILSDKLKITFMPYKADMWTSMASIWEMALRDDECEVSVVPLPYYDITNLENVFLCYEAERFPKDVRCIHYDEYSEEKEYPDIIVIHNPYDEENNVTRVPERFYSTTLLNHTAKLVYAPYFTIGSFTMEKHGWILGTPANINSDVVLAQSERVKQIYLEFGYADEKILSYGSPKIDAVVQMAKKNKELLFDELPVEWKEKLHGKKVFLLNTHLSYFPNCTLYMHKNGNYAARFHDEIMDTFLNREDCALIWRPHPLLKTMIKRRFPEWLEYVEGMENRIRESSNGIVDELGDYTYSFVISDALLTTYSSLMNEYMISKKPVMIFQTRLSERVAAISPLNFNVNYYRFGEGFLTFGQFRDYVLRGWDPKYEERLAELNKAFPNLDGKAGEKIYMHLKNSFI